MTVIRKWRELSDLPCVKELGMGHKIAHMIGTAYASRCTTLALGKNIADGFAKGLDGGKNIRREPTEVMRNMAKLEGVKVIDMVDGEVTKVAYNGEEYVEVEIDKSGDIRNGDLGLRVKHHVDGVAEVGNYYRMGNRRTNRVGYIDEEGDYIFTSNINNFQYFRKEEQYREIDRDVQVGDFLKFDRDEGIPGYVSHGHYYEIVRIDWNDDPQILDDDGNKYDTYNKEFTVYEKATDESVEGESIVGKTVKVTKCLVGDLKGYAGYSYRGQGLVAIGSVGEVKEEVTDGIYVRFDAAVTDHVELSYISNFFLADGEYEIIDDASDEKTSIKVGDYAKVIGETYYGDITRGTKVKIVGDVDHDGDYQIELMDGSDYDYAKEYALEMLDEESTDSQATEAVDKAKKGDLIRITNKTLSNTMRDMTEGKVYKVVDEVLPSEYFANIIDEKGREASAIDGGYEVVTHDIDAVKEYFAEGSKVQINIPEDESTKYSRGGITNDDVGEVVKVKEHPLVDVVIVEIDFPGRELSWNGSPEELIVVEVAEEEVDTIIPRKAYVTTKDGFFGDIPKGTKVFSDGDVNSRGHRVFLMDETDFDRIKPEHLAEITPKEGDIVRVIDSTCGHTVGTIGEITEVNYNSDVFVKAIYKGELETYIESHFEIIARKEDRIDV